MKLKIAPLVALLLLGQVGRAAVLASGTRLEIRIKTRVASNASQPKDAVEAVLIQPLVDGGGEIVLPAGTVLRGSIIKATPIKTPTDRAELGLAFEALEAAAPKALKLETRVVEVDNARETVASSGIITGILASETIAARIGQGVDRVSKKNSKLGGFLSTVQAAVLREPQPEIIYEPGVELTLELQKPLELTGVVTQPFSIPAVEPESALFDLVNSQPWRTATEGKGIPSDLTNLMFLGSQEQLEAAFTAAGWSSAAKLDSVSGLEVFRAMAESRGYKEAPMSILLLDGQKPAMVFQKQNNTFEKRHHLRIWRRPVTFEGREVWVCAATHDIGIEFSPEKRTFIHKIDPQIDRERAKVVSDLIFGGHAKALSLVTRPEAPQHSQNATGDDLITDGAMAVLALE